MSIEISDVFDFAINTVSENVDSIPPVKWIEDNFIDPVSKRKIILEPFQKRILEKALEIDDYGFSKYDLVVWSQPKKSGKTAIAGAVGCWFANNIEQPNEICCVANDQEQSRGRIYSAMLPTLKNIGWSGTETASPSCGDSNGTIVKAITTRYEKEAGGNQGLSLWSELWAFSSERLTRLWEEMTPPPTRKFRMRWVETYAGFRNESVLLRNLYKRIFMDDTEIRLQPGVRKLWDDLPVYDIPSKKTFVFWDHDHRMDWQTDEYYAVQKFDLRSSSYMRLHENKWIDSSEQFITEDMWNKSLYDEFIVDDYLKRGGLTYALDGSKNGACTALVGSIADKELGMVITPDIHIWEPPPGKEIDQNEVMKKIKELYHSGMLRAPLFYDPHLLVKMAQDLRNDGISCKEFPQGSLRIKSDTFLYKLYQDGKIMNVDDLDLKRHLLACQSKDHGNDKIRIIKPSSKSKKYEDGDNVHMFSHVDAGVAQAMSAYKAYTRTSGGWSFTGRPL